MIHGDLLIETVRGACSYGNCSLDAGDPRAEKRVERRSRTAPLLAVTIFGMYTDDERSRGVCACGVVDGQTIQPPAQPILSRAPGYTPLLLFPELGADQARL